MNQDLILLLLCFSLFIACNKKDDANTPGDFGDAYYPFSAGSFVEYEIEAFYYDDFFTPVKIDTLHFFCREVLDSSFLDAAQRKSFKVLRYTKEEVDDTYALSDVWYATRTNDRLEIVEENVRFIKLTFPLRFGNVWDGNALNTSPKENYQVGYIGKPEVLNGMPYKEVVQVVHFYEENLIEKRFQEERFAKGIGMIYKKSLDVRTEVGGGIQSGFDISWKAINYGKEN
jgi:hypothetical protein